MNGTLSEFIGAFCTELEFEDLVSERFREINSMKDLTFDARLLIQDVTTTCTRVIQQCNIYLFKITRLIYDGETSLSHGHIYTIDEMDKLHRSLDTEIERRHREDSVY